MKQERNAPCACGSGLKHKKCCLPILDAKKAERVIKRRMVWQMKYEAAKRRREEYLKNQSNLIPSQPSAEPC